MRGNRPLVQNRTLNNTLWERVTFNDNEPPVNEVIRLSSNQQVVGYPLYKYLWANKNKLICLVTYWEYWEYRIKSKPLCPTEDDHKNIKCDHCLLELWLHYETNMTCCCMCHIVQPLSTIHVCNPIGCTKVKDFACKTSRQPYGRSYREATLSCIFLSIRLKAMRWGAGPRDLGEAIREGYSLQGAPTLRRGSLIVPVGKF